jgi:hypothetical protein
MQASPVLLILDSHNSRQKSAALHLLQLFRVEVLILPSHTAHLIQMFAWSTDPISMAGTVRKDFGSSAGKESAKDLGRDNGSVFPARSRGFEIVDSANAQP